MVNFYYNGVSSSSSYSKEALIYPKHDRSPTTQTTKRPSPSNTLVPDSRAGEGIRNLSFSPNSAPSLINSSFLDKH